MNYSVTIDNHSGAAQTAAIFIIDPGGDGYSLVWQVAKIPDTGSRTLSWDGGDFGLGWGTSEAQLDYGLQYASGQAPVAVDPFAADGNNTLPIGYDGGFVAGAPYRDAAIQNSVNIVTDRGFTVADAALMSVALYVGRSPALAMRGAPNTVYNFEPERIVYCLSVTSGAPGVVLRPPAPARRMLRAAAISVSAPVQLPLGPGSPQLRYTLDKTMTFRLAPN